MVNEETDLETRDLVKILNRLKGKFQNLFLQLHRFAIDAAHSKIVFSASGVFNIDRELLLTVRIVLRSRERVCLHLFSRWFFSVRFIGNYQHVLFHAVLFQHKIMNERRHSNR